jgi:glycosyltransferase involved in cell wall biosynthesis
VTTFTRHRPSSPASHDVPPSSRVTRPLACIARQTDLYEPQIQREAEALVAAGFDVDVFCMRNAERPRQTVINEVRVISLPSSRRKGSRLRYAIDYVGFFGLLTVTLALRHLRRPYAVVQVNTMPDFLVFAAAVPKRLGARVVAYMHEPSPELAETLYGPSRMVRLLELIEQRALRFADHSIAVTEELKQRYVERGACPDRLTVVLNGHAPDNLLQDWTPPPDEPSRGFTLVCHGSIEERYGQDTIIEAVGLLREAIPGLRLVITGRGSGVDAMCQLIDQSDLGGLVHFEGWVSRQRLNDLLHSADVGIVAQKATPYSHLVQTNKMGDYWIFGLPVVASRLRAVSSMYDDSVIEYYEAGDARALASAILRLYADPQRRAELARNGRLAHLRHGWAVERLTYLDVYEALLGGPARSSPRSQAGSSSRPEPATANSGRAFT